MESLNIESNSKSKTSLVLSLSLSLIFIDSLYGHQRREAIQNQKNLGQVTCTGLEALMKLGMTKFSHHNPTINALSGMNFAYLKEGIRRGQNLPASSCLIPPQLRCVCVHALLISKTLISCLYYSQSCPSPFYLVFLALISVEVISWGWQKCLRRAPPKPTLPCASFPYPKMKARRP